MHNSILQAFLGAPRAIKRAISIGYDCLAITLAFYLAYALRMGELAVKWDVPVILCLAVTLAVSILAFIRMGLYRAILRYITQQAINTLVVGVLISSAVMAVTGFFLHAFLPRSVPIIYALTAFILIGMPRILLRNMIHMLIPKGKIKVVIYGAGSAGSRLASQLSQGTDFSPVAFVDDDKKLVGNIQHGLTVYEPNKLNVLIERYQVTRVLLALGGIDHKERIRIIRYLEPLLVQVQTIPPMEEIMKGSAQINDLRNIQIEDLLGREAVAPKQELLALNTTGKTVMVTGAGGSIGSELCKQLVQQNPSKIVLFERNEYNLYQIERELKENYANKSPVKIINVLGSIQNEKLLNRVIHQLGVDIIYHTAAYKHVPIVEKNIVEGVKNNLLGTKNVAEAALKNKVKHLILVSTDKAVRPTNIMGATKRLAEMVLQDLAVSSTHTIFSMVRFGNVLDSSGSVVPRFRQQISSGGPITVTHELITRYFMTIKEAAQLVIQAGALAKGGDVFVLDMGEPVKIIDLAKEMALLSGRSIKSKKNPHGDIEIKITGLRPGEKLYEELLCDANCEGTTHPRIMRASEKKMPTEVLAEILAKAELYCEQYRHQDLLNLLKSADIEYSAPAEIGELKYGMEHESENVINITTATAKKLKVE